MTGGRGVGRGIWPQGIRRIDAPPVTAVMAPETVGANPLRTRDALVGVSLILAVATKVGANPVRTSDAFADVTIRGVLTVGAKVARTRDAFAGVTTRGVLTVGAK